MVKLFREALLDALETRGVTLKSVADAAGVSEEQLKKVRQGKSRSTNVDDAVKVAHVFGVTLDEFLQDDFPVIRSRIAEFYSSLTEEEVQILLDAERGRSVRGQREGA